MAALSKINEPTGLSYGQILATLTFIALLMSAWISLSNQTTANKIEIENIKSDRIKERNEQLEYARENKSDHMILSDKMDRQTETIIETIAEYKHKN